MLPVDFGLGVTGGHGAAASCGALGPLQLTQCVVRIYHFFIGHGTGEAERHRTQGSRWAKRPTRERTAPEAGCHRALGLLSPGWSVDPMLCVPISAPTVLWLVSVAGIIHY